jgi:hypothetical protein
MNKLLLKIIPLGFLLFYGCSNTDDKLRNYIETHCDFTKSDICYIDMKDALKIDYDKMYLFGETTMADEISTVLGIPYSNDKYISDSKYRIIFIKNGKIVYENDYYQKYTRFFGVNNKVIEVNFYCVLYTNSIFVVEKRKYEGQYPYIYYLLRSEQKNATIKK